MDERASETLGARLRGKRWQESDGRRVVPAWSNSGESAGVFARRLGVDEQRLYWWRRRLGHSAAQPAPPPSALEQALAAPVLLPVTIRRGHRAGGGDAALVAERGHAYRWSSGRGIRWTRDDGESQAGADRGARFPIPVPHHA